MGKRGDGHKGWFLVGAEEETDMEKYGKWRTEMHLCSGWGGDEENQR